MLYQMESDGMEQGWSPEGKRLAKKMDRKIVQAGGQVRCNW